MDAVLARDADLARQLALVREELVATIHINESMGAPSTRAMERAFAQIGYERATARKPRSSILTAAIARPQDFHILEVGKIEATLHSLARAGS